MPQTELQRLWYQKNKERVKTNVRNRARALRLELLEKLGNKCACCDEAQLKFLAIDHINGISDEERELAAKSKRGIKGGKRLRLSGDMLCLFAMARLEQFRILCHNCNMGRHLNGGCCPHEDQ
jgi:hypothetical protein